MIKKGWCALLGAMLFFLPVGAVELDLQLQEALSKKQADELLRSRQELENTLRFQQFHSFASLDAVLQQFLRSYKKLYPQDSRLIN